MIKNELFGNKKILMAMIDCTVLLSPTALPPSRTAPLACVVQCTACRGETKVVQINVIVAVG